MPRARGLNASVVAGASDPAWGFDAAGILDPIISPGIGSYVRERWQRAALWAQGFAQRIRPLLANRPPAAPPVAEASLWARAMSFARRYPWTVGVGLGLALPWAAYLIGRSQGRKETVFLRSNRPTTRVDYYVQRF